MKKKKLKKKLKKMSKRLEELYSLSLNQHWIAKTIGEYNLIQGRLFRLEQIYNQPVK